MRKTGNYITSTTSGEKVKAFVPLALPPNPPIHIDEEMKELLAEVAVAVEKLEFASRMVPSQEWLLYGFVRKEAVISSQIEGTQSTLIDLLSANENHIENEDLEEVCNYLKALEYAWGQLTSETGLPLSLRLIKETHKRLLKGARGKSKSPGQFRVSQNWIGGTRPSKAMFVPPPPKAMMQCLNDFEKYLHSQSKNPFIDIALIHVQFESIHPFLDGNGRIGRLLIALLLKYHGLINSPLLYLSLFFKRNRDTYYRLLNAVRYNGEWEEWIKFFLEGVCSVSKDVIETSAKLQNLLSHDRQKILNDSKVTISTIRLLEALPKKPIVTLNQASEILKLTKPPVIKALNILMECGVLTEVTGKKKDKVYRYEQYLNILAEGTEL